MNIEGLELKPSQITIEDEDMYPKESNFISHQNTGIKWRKDMKSLMAKNSKEQRIYVGDRVRNGVNGESGKVDEFFLKDEDQSSDSQSIFASVQCDNSSTIAVNTSGLVLLNEPNVYEGNDHGRVTNLIQLSTEKNMDLYNVPVNVFVDDTSANSEGKVMYDSYLKKEVIVTSQLGIGLMDNAMAAEFCEPRTKEKTEEILKEVDQYPSHSTNHGIKRKKKADELNKAELWDPHRDLPPDLLHCRYLDIAILHAQLLHRFTEEAGESWCGIVKNCQYITNHHNPNRDTAYKLTHVEEIGHIMDNGTWKVNGKRVNPARQTVEEICHSRIQSFVFGNQTENNDGHSSVKRSHDGLIKKSRGRTKTGEKLRKGDVIYYFNNDQVKFGEIMNISTTLIDISRMVKLDDEDRVFNCYKLRKSSDELSLAIDDVQGIVYVVHDCGSCGCCVIMTRNDGKISRVFKHNFDHPVF
ncbi:unnamed protein product [Mytilus edulis]|uniref:Uncharacterized protein n=1 Tax=Mytilus edulis TaxID=6550 RepID=A0A8S3RES6_MYTED|nr:unnamed protein product [Mytilus edulis]